MDITSQGMSVSCDKIKLTNLLLDKLTVTELKCLEEMLDAPSTLNKSDDVGFKKLDIRLVSQEEFCQSIVKLLGKKDFEEAANCLYNQIKDSSSDHTVTWEKFLDYFLNHLQGTRTENNPPIDTDYGFKLLTHNKRECTVRVLLIDGTPPVYLFVSKLGSVGVYTTKLRLTKSYTIQVKKSISTTAEHSSAKCASYVNDAIHMADCKKLVIATSRRTLHFYDISASNHIEEFRLYGLPSVPMCLAYSSKTPEQKQASASQLFVGYGNGSVQIFYFSEAETLLFKKSQLNQVQLLSFQDIDNHKQYVTCTILADLHFGSINRILYFRNNDTLVTCSDDICRSIVIRDIEGRRKEYVIHLDKGVRCCDYSVVHKVLVGGGLDKIVRIWDPYCPNQPTSCLKGHDAIIVDMKIHKEQPWIFSYSQDGILKVWCIHEEVCMQTLRLNFPAFFVLGHDPEHGNFSLHVDTQEYNTLLITCSEWVTELKLQKNIADTSMPIANESVPQILPSKEKFMKNQKSSSTSVILPWSSQHSSESSFKHTMEFIKAVEELLPEFANKSDDIQKIKSRNLANETETVSEPKMTSQEGMVAVGQCQLYVNECISTTDELKETNKSNFTTKIYYLSNGQSFNEDISLKNCTETDCNIDITDFLKKLQEEKDVSSDDDQEIFAVEKELPLLDYLTEEQKEETIQNVIAARKSMTRHLYRRMHHREEEFLSEEETRRYIRETAPHWALKMHPLVDINFQEDLPISERMRNKGMVIRNEADLRNLDLLSLKADASDTDSRRSSMASGVSRRARKAFRPALAFVTSSSPSRRSSNTSSKSSASSSTLKVPLKKSIMKLKPFT